LTQSRRADQIRILTQKSTNGKKFGGGGGTLLKDGGRKAESPKDQKVWEQPPNTTSEQYLEGDGKTLGKKNFATMDGVTALGNDNKKMGSNISGTLVGKVKILPDN